MAKEKPAPVEPRFDVRGAAISLKKGVSPELVFGIPYVPQIKLTGLDPDYTTQNPRATRNQSHKKVMNTLRYAFGTGVNEVIGPQNIAAHLPKDSELVTPVVLMQFMHRAEMAFDLIHPAATALQKHPKPDSLFEIVLDRTINYFAILREGSIKNTVRGSVVGRVIAETHTSKRLPAYLKLLADVYRRDMGKVPTVATLRMLVFNSLPVFAKPTRHNIAYHDAFNSIATPSYIALTGGYAFNPSVFGLVRGGRMCVQLLPEWQKVVDEEYELLMKTPAHDVLVTGCPANKDPLPGSETSTSLLMTVVHKAMGLR